MGKLTVTAEPGVPFIDMSREFDAPRKVAQRVVEIFLARHFTRVAELPTDFVSPFEQRDAMSAFGERGRARQPCRPRPDDRHRLHPAQCRDRRGGRRRMGAPASVQRVRAVRAYGRAPDDILRP